MYLKKDIIRRGISYFINICRISYSETVITIRLTQILQGIQTYFNDF